MELLKSLKRKASKFFSLENSFKWRFIKYFLSYPFYLAIFRTAGFKRTKGYIEYRISKKNNSTSNVTFKAAEDISSTINLAASNFPLSSSCLEKSIFIYFILALNGIESDIKIGVDKDNNEFKAHAWVEKEGLVLKGSEGPLDKYSSF